MTLETDYHIHARSCHKCQIYVDKVHVPPMNLNVLTYPWPFIIWGIYMIGCIKLYNLHACMQFQVATFVSISNELLGHISIFLQHETFSSPLPFSKKPKFVSFAQESMVYY